MLTFRNISLNMVVFVLLVPLCASGAFGQQTVPDDQVLAKIGTKTVTEGDLKQMANAVPEKFRYYYQTPEGRRQTLDYIVNIYILAAEAEKEGLDKSPDSQKLLAFTRNDLLARMLLEKMTKDSPAPTDVETKKYFEQNKAEFSTPESVKLRHILVETEKEIKDVLARLKKGDKFEDIASQVSICPSKVRGGDLDWMPRGSLVPEIEDVAYKMNKGQIEGPVKTKFGYHVLYLEDKKPGEEASFDQVKDYIVEQLKYQKQQEQYEKIADSLRKKMNVQILLPNDTPQALEVAPGAGPTAKPKN
ncbi:MAG: peptidylprolyl isomerase [Deltaproteobacteria bacterium]|nr:peptidylprolyl isomerase [Deltaproteobacteria bacterium]